MPSRKGPLDDRADALEAAVASFVVEERDPALDELLVEYREHARQVCRRPPLEALVGRLLGIHDFDIEQVFIPLATQPVSSSQLGPRADTPGDAPRSAAAIVSVSDLWPARTPWLVLLGESGAGKSVAVRRLALEGLQGSGRIPVRVELRRYAKWVAERSASVGVDLFAYLDALHREEGVALTGIHLRWLALAGRIAWLVDGLDEVSDGELRFRCAVQLANLRRRGGAVLLTSRPRGVTREVHLLQPAARALPALPFKCWNDEVWAEVLTMAATARPVLHRYYLSTSSSRFVHPHAHTASVVSNSA